MKRYIYGGGGHAKVVLDCLLAQDIGVEFVIDYKYDCDLLGVRRLKQLPEGLDADSQIVIAIGDNKVRKEISAGLKTGFFNVVHPTALVSKHAVIGAGCMLLHRAIVQAGCRIGSHVILNTASQVDHDCTIGDFVHLAPASVLCGSVNVGEGTLIGAGAVVKPGVRIGAWATIGSGTVVIKDVPDHAVVVGNPGKIIKYLQP
jgi:sugar O-acyltransferase (sialic acid O-acetyltransferase NeuD family)